MMKPIVSLGTIIPLGDGMVGKTVIMQLLLNPDANPSEVNTILDTTKKSKNIEIEFDFEETEIDGIPIKTSLQYYNFPGQIQKESSRTVTFQEILQIFDFLPALNRANVILMLYDTSRIYTLKSLENWLRVALSKNWIGENTLVMLVSNKIDIQEPNHNFVEQIKEGIKNFLEREGLGLTRVDAISTSCKTKEGIIELRNNIVDWIALTGKKNAPFPPQV